jgi:NTE family protein
MVALLRGAAQSPSEEGARWARMRIHRIASEVMLDLGSSSKLSAEWEFMIMLRDEGRKAAEAFLCSHCDDLGRASSFDLNELVQGV